MFKVKCFWVYFIVYYDGEDLVGFIYLIVGYNVNYLMYLVVNDWICFKGYGIQILIYLKVIYLV